MKLKIKLRLFLMLILCLGSFSCTSLEKKLGVSSESFSIETQEISAENYEGEYLNFEIKSYLEKNFNLKFEVNLFALIDNKEYPLKRKSSFNVKPSGSIEFGVDNKKNTSESIELGIRINQSNHLSEINNISSPAIINIRPKKVEVLNFRLINKNLFYIKNGEEIPINEEQIQGEINIYTTRDNIFIGSIPIKLKIK